MARMFIARSMSSIERPVGNVAQRQPRGIADGAVDVQIERAGEPRLHARVARRVLAGSRFQEEQPDRQLRAVLQLHGRVELISRIGGVGIENEVHALGFVDTEADFHVVVEREVEAARGADVEHEGVEPEVEVDREGHLAAEVQLHLDATCAVGRNDRVVAERQIGEVADLVDAVNAVAVLVAKDVELRAGAGRRACACTRRGTRAPGPACR